MVGVGEGGVKHGNVSSHFWDRYDFKILKLTNLDKYLVIAQLLFIFRNFYLAL